MSFGDIFWPTFTALVSAFVILEVFHILMGRWMSKRQERRQKEEMAQMVAKGFDPSNMILMGRPPGAEGFPFPIPSSNNEEEEDAEIPTGQYL